MPTANIDQGIVIDFGISQSKDLTQYVKNIPPCIGAPEDFTNLSMNCMDPAELANSGLSRSERRRLIPMTKHILRQLGNLNIVGTQLQTGFGTLSPKNDQVGIVVKPNEDLTEARSIAAEIIFEELGIFLPISKPDEWYIPVAQRTSRSRRLPEYKKPMPPFVVIGNVTVGVATIDQKSRRKPKPVKRLYRPT